MLNTRHSVRSVPGRSVVVYEVARGFSDGQEFATSINVANEGSVTGVTELGVQPAPGAWGGGGRRMRMDGWCRDSVGRRALNGRGAPVV